MNSSLGGSLFVLGGVGVDSLVHCVGKEKITP